MAFSFVTHYAGIWVTHQIHGKRNAGLGYICLPASLVVIKGVRSCSRRIAASKDGGEPRRKRSWLREVPARILILKVSGEISANSPPL